MRFCVDRPGLARELAWHGAGPEPRLLRITLSDDCETIVMTSSTDEAWRTSHLPVQNASEPGEVIISPARLTQQVAAQKKSETVTVAPAQSGNMLTTKVGRSEASHLLARQMMGYWEPRGDRDVIATVSRDDFRWAVNVCVAAAAAEKDKSDETTKAIHLVTDDGHVRMVTSDGYRLADISLDAKTDDQSEGQSEGDDGYLFMPRDIVSTLKIMDEPLTILDAQGHIGLSDGTRTIVVRGLAERARDGSRLVAQAFKVGSGITVPMDDLMSALASVSSGPRSYVDMKFSCEDQSVTVATSDRTTGEDCETGRTETVVTAEEFTLDTDGMVSLNTGYLTTVLGALKTDRVRLLWAGEKGKPLIIRTPSDHPHSDDYVSLIQVLRPRVR